MPSSLMLQAMLRMACNISPFYPHGGIPVPFSKGVNGTELLGYIEARKQIYIPTYRWMQEHKVPDIIEQRKKASKTKNIVLLDYGTNCDVNDPMNRSSRRLYLSDKQCIHNQ